MNSDNVKKGPERAPNRSLFYALGYTPEELDRPLIGVVSAYSEIVPGHAHLDKIADAVKAGVRMAGGTPILIPTIGVCDGIAMGHVGMKYSLASRELICDSVETMFMAHQLDGLVLVPNCDKIVPGMKFLTYAAPAIRNAMMDMVRDAFAAFEQRMVTEDKDGVYYQRVSLDDVLPGEEQLRRIEAIADPYAMQPQNIMEEQESRRELYNGLQRLTDREQTYLLYRYGFTDGEEHPLIGTAIYFHLTKSRAKKTEEQAMDNLWLELPWWFI